MKYIEPDLEVHIPPGEGSYSILSLAEDDAEAGSNSYYVICWKMGGHVSGWGPFHSYNQADNQHTQGIQACDAVLTTPTARFHDQRKDGMWFPDIEAAMKQ